MKMRELLADWISGGAIARRLVNFDVSITRRNAIIESMDLCISRMQVEHAHALNNLQCALHAIAAQEKTTSNATVRRMARIAREALK